MKTKIKAGLLATLIAGSSLLAFNAYAGLDPDQPDGCRWLIIWECKVK